MGDDVRALPICEIRTSREFFDYEAKYHASDTEEIVPAPVTRGGYATSYKQRSDGHLTVRSIVVAWPAWITSGPVKS
jgi:hypothetical protein